MKVKDDNLWLCQDCLQVAVNADYTGLQYYYSEEEADKREQEINEGLERLGKYLVPHFNTEEETGYCCGDCGNYFYKSEAAYIIDDFDDNVPACPECNSDYISEIGNGYQEFSSEDCDCCGSTLAGSLWRFATLEED